MISGIVKICEGATSQEWLLSICKRVHERFYRRVGHDYDRSLPYWMIEGDGTRVERYRCVAIRTRIAIFEIAPDRTQYRGKLRPHLMVPAAPHLYRQFRSARSLRSLE